MSKFLSPTLKALTPYVPGEQPKDIERLIKLNTNENPYPPSPRVWQSITQKEIDSLSLYSDPNCTDFINAAADYSGVLPENIYPGNGSDEVLAFIFHALCGNGVVFPDISYGFYTVFADMFSVAYKQIPLREDFSISPDDYATEKGTVLIANPNAPTGLYLPPSEIEKLLNQDRDRLVVIDEAYIDFGGESASRLLPSYDNLLIVRTMSKSHSLAGARVGYAVGSKELIGDLNTAKFSFNPFNVDRLAIIAGTQSISDRVYFEECRDKIIKSREYTAKNLKEMGFKVLNSMTNFVFAGEHNKLRGEDYFKKLRDNAILTRYFPSARIDDYVRITIGTQEQMEELIRVTAKILEECS